MNTKADTARQSVIPPRRLKSIKKNPFFEEILAQAQE